MDADILPRINRVIVTGFIQQDPELRHTPSGVAVASFRVRSGHFTRDRRGGLRETISYFTVVVWQELAQRICREAKNGQGIVVEGALHSRSFLTATGERKTVVEIYADSAETVPVFLPERESKPQAAAAATARSNEETSSEDRHYEHEEPAHEEENQD